jgi:hypothetical protein
MLVFYGAVIVLEYLSVASGTMGTTTSLSMQVGQHRALKQQSASGQKDDRIIYFLHIHKSAGTHFCRTARENKLNVSKTNCNVQKDQRCCGSDDTLEAQRAYAASTQYDLVANERDMYNAMDISSYRYVVMLRDSKERYRSHWKNMCRVHNDTSTTFHTWWTRQPDNWNVRKICGTRCQNVPKYQITEELFEYTLERLRLFEDILFVERFDETYRTFAKRVGWNRPPPKMIRYDTSFLYAKASSREADWEPMMSALDDVLYEYAMDLYEGGEQPPTLGKKRMNRLQRYLTDGPRRMCNSECCHLECSTY